MDHRISIARRAAQALRERIGPCPITCGQRTRMFEATFRRICKGHLDPAKGTGRFNYNSGRAPIPPVCKQCNGKLLPPELEFIPEPKKEDVTMPTKISKKGPCELCGRKATLVKNHGVNVCSSCKNVQAKISKNPQQVVAAMIRIHGDTYFPAAVDHETIAELKEITGLDAAETRPDLVEVVKVLVDQADQVNIAIAVKDAMEQRLHKEEAARSLFERFYQDVLELLGRADDVGTDKALDLLQSRLAAGEDVALVSVGAADMIPLSRLINDSQLRASVNTLAEHLAAERG